MKNCEYKCVLTGENFNEIHHIHGFNLILKEVIIENEIEIKENFENYTDQELDRAVNLFRTKQDEYPLGVCLKIDIHKLFHNKYGYGNNTEEQWEEFVRDYKNGKYKDVA